MKNNDDRDIKAFIKEIEDPAFKNALINMNKTNPDKAWKKVSGEMVKLKSPTRKVRYVPLSIASIAATLLIFYFISLFYVPEKAQDMVSSIEKVDYGDVHIIDQNNSVLNIKENSGGKSIAEINISELNLLPLDSSKTNTLSNIYYNTLVVPKGKKARIKLDDGTVVWLNADSKLKYPVKFLSENREVELTGEGYFIVAHNKSKPFIVRNSEIAIKVLGTKFNISNWENSERADVTLVSGSVEVKAGSQLKTLDPNQKFSLEKQSQSINISVVDAIEQISWINDIIYLRSSTLSEISKILDRWYGVNVMFENEAMKNIKISGEINRSDNPEVIIDIICKTAKLNWKCMPEKGAVMIQNR